MSEQGHEADARLGRDAARRPSLRATLPMLGPAFVASVAYVDPGNVAANLSAGADFGYLLVWVLVLASLMAMIVQYLSAKLGLVTGRSLSALIRGSLSRRPHGRALRGAFAAQAIIVAMATDLAEVVGGAIALNLLFGLPGWLGGLIVAAVSLVGLGYLRRRGEKAFDVGITMILAIIAFGFLAGLVWAPPDPAGVVGGLVPRFAGAQSVSIAAAMLGATVMPHAIYLHSTLAIDRHRPTGRLDHPVRWLLFVQKVDVSASLLISGTVNIAMLLFGATLLRHQPHSDAITAAHQVLGADLGPVPAVIFGVGLLASSVGSSVVGTHAGASIMGDLLPFASHDHVRRAATLLPAVVILFLGINPTEALVISQLVLSFGIAFAVIPLARYSSDRSLLGEFASSRWLAAVTWLITGLVLALNVAVIVLTLGG